MPLVSISWTIKCDKCGGTRALDVAVNPDSPPAVDLNTIIDTAENALRDSIQVSATDMVMHLDDAFYVENIEVLTSNAFETEIAKEALCKTCLGTARADMLAHIRPIMERLAGEPTT